MLPRLLVSVMLSAITGCATIMTGGTNQGIRVGSSPAGARVFIDGRDSGITPIASAVDRRDPHEIRIELEGYKTYIMKMSPGMNGWYFGNFLIGGAPGMVVDLIDGAYVIEYPDSVNAVLVPDTTGMSSTAIADPTEPRLVPTKPQPGTLGSMPGWNPNVKGGERN